jgi:Endosomal/lysosomal potassium channel TMEM175
MAFFRAAAFGAALGLTERAKQLNQQRSGTTGGGFDMDQSGGDRTTYPSDRLVAFTDAVMAVAITLLVLDLKLPAGVTDAELPGVLAASSHQLWCYVLSFLVIGFFVDGASQSILIHRPHRWRHDVAEPAFSADDRAHPICNERYERARDAAADHALRRGAVLNERAAWRHLGLCASRSRADGG